MPLVIRTPLKSAAVEKLCKYMGFRSCYENDSLKKRSLLNTLLDGVALELSVRFSVITQSLHIRLLAADYLEGTHEFLVQNQGNADLTCIQCKLSLVYHC